MSHLASNLARKAPVRHGMPTPPFATFHGEKVMNCSLRQATPLDHHLLKCTALAVCRISDQPQEQF